MPGIISRNGDGAPKQSGIREQIHYIDNTAASGDHRVPGFYHEALMMHRHVNWELRTQLAKTRRERAHLHPFAASSIALGLNLKINNFLLGGERKKLNAAREAAEAQEQLKQSLANQLDQLTQNYQDAKDAAARAGESITDKEVKAYHSKAKKFEAQIRAAEEHLSHLSEEKRNAQDAFDQRYALVKTLTDKRNERIERRKHIKQLAAEAKKLKRAARSARRHLKSAHRAHTFRNPHDDTNDVNQPKSHFYNGRKAATVLHMAIVGGTIYGLAKNYIGQSGIQTTNITNLLFTYSSHGVVNFHVSTETDMILTLVGGAVTYLGNFARYARADGIANEPEMLM